MSISISLKLAFVLSILCFFIIPTLIIFCFYHKKKVLKILGIIFFIVFCIGVSCLVFGRPRIGKGLASVHFDFSKEWFSLKFLWMGNFTIDLIYNLIMFIPIGAFVISQTTKKRFLKTVLISFVMSFIIELFQFILPISRYSELFDLVTNTISGIIGYLIFSVIAWLTKKIRKIED